MTTELERARSLLRDADRWIALTGAGISAESGVPTFRGPGGLWRSYRAEELATPTAFSRDPDLVWQWYRWRRGLIEACSPNAAHVALARAVLARTGTARIITQNVDGLHHRAARSAASAISAADPTPAYPLEVHGAIHRDRCSGCGRRSDPRAEADDAPPPLCDACGHLLRPDVVWFGEMLDEQVLSEAFAAAENADVCLVIGTSALVHPAASLPLITARAGGHIVEVNPDPTPLSPSASVRLAGTACEWVPRLFETS